MVILSLHIHKIQAILDLVAKHDDNFCQSYIDAARNAVYTSPKIQNQLPVILSNCSEVLSDLALLGPF